MKRIMIVLATFLVLAAAPAYAQRGHRGGGGWHGRAHVSHGGGYHRHAGGYRGGYRGGAYGYRGGGYGYRRGYGVPGAAVGLGLGAAGLAAGALAAPYYGQQGGCPSGYYLASDYQCYPY
jgi:hypothetical protein